VALPEFPEKLENVHGEELEGLDEVVYVRPEDGACFSLNITAAAVLELCNGKRSSADIAREIEAALPNGSAQAAADVESIIGTFVEYGLIYADDSDNA